MYGVVLLSNIPLESRDWQKNVNHITLAKKIALFCLIIFEDITCIGTQLIKAWNSQTVALRTSRIIIVTCLKPKLVGTYEYTTNTIIILFEKSVEYTLHIAYFLK